MKILTPHASVANTNSDYFLQIFASGGVSEVKLQGKKKKKKVSLAEHETGFTLTTQSQQLVPWRRQESWRQHTLLCDC